ncbi:uncharacterized protein [Nicotiana sylvestris]|uniref:uncharacterized protein n=1 Tax=Nicotiana sylvestris TaxID=4096 RepID=UPI00388C750A
MKSIVTICRNYLWDGRVITNKPSLVAWDTVCRPKKEGGLGIHECIVWNEATIAKYAWNIEQKCDTLWVRWVNHVYIKGKDWWQYKPPQDCTWYWKKICDIKEKFKDGFEQRGWKAKNKQYTIKDGYNWRRGEAIKWPYARWIWNRLNVPKHCFIGWAIMKKRLLTRDRLNLIGVSQEKTCLLCERADETIQHLFFECKYSRRLLEYLCKWLKIKINNADQNNIWRKIGRCIKGRICRNFVASIITTIMYGIWRARNEALWNKAVPIPEKVWQGIKEDNKYRVQEIKDSRKNRKEKEWINTLYR